MIKRIALCFAVAVLAFALSGCGTEPSESEPVTVAYWAKKIAYAYREKEANTGRFGEVLGYDHYIVFGVVNDDGGITECKEQCDYGYFNVHSLNVSESDYGYIWYTAVNGAIADYDFYLTADMMENWGGNQ